MSASPTAGCDMCGRPVRPHRQSSTSPPRARYCSNACRQRSYRMRQKSGGMDTALVETPLTQMSSFIGRTDELIDLARILRESRLLTLTGPAGVGKTRLALELAGQEARGRRHEVAVVKLGQLTEPEEIRQRILTTVDAMPDSADGAEKDRLLLLDDCEHVLDTCGTLLTDLLPRHPRLRILVTSREPLRLPGESVFPVIELALPDLDSGTVLAACLRSDAVTLFMDRARAVAPDFQLTEANAADVGEICVRLDGVPLPIEMAARLMRVFPPAEVRDRMDDRLALLTNGWRLADGRHRSLRASLEWGYDLLSTAERALLRRLSVLPGGFGPDAAAALAADIPEVVSAMPEILIGLEAKSVITPVPGDDGPARFRLLESMRHFGHEMLVAQGEDTAAYERLTARLTTASLPLREEAVAPAGTLRMLEKEHANLTHALRRLGSGDDERQLLLAAALAAAEVAGGRHTGAAEHVAHALDRTAPTSVYRGVALEAAAALARREGEDAAAARQADEAVALERERGGGTARLGRLLLLRGTIRQLADEREASRADLTGALNIGLRLSHNMLTALSLGQIARQQMENGELGSAEQTIRRVLPALRRHAAPFRLRSVLVTAGALALEKDDLTLAEAHFTEVLCVRPAHPSDTAAAIEGLALVATRARRFDRGLRLLGAAERIRDNARRDTEWWRRRVHEARETALRAMPPARAEAWLDSGQGLPEHQAISLALGDDGPGTHHKRPAHPLSRRERDVAELVVEGLTNRQIAARMHVSVRTVETHIRHIRTTLGLRSRAHIAAWVAQRQPKPPARLTTPPAEQRMPQVRSVVHGARVMGGPNPRQLNET
ncbi:ATP-binding protein [Streptomyces malaysiensis]|uniref:LuxR C-terminal-related transcriptional regulator n=1 Tax=Streptomyces malaysiensis subsp. samsunensis TaxID=459658 RepID=A0A9X2M689_STRMQ|nr:LuxR C-terminal-related transcriptional regulator [Streptomyces samsunensis]MCQ8835914.1 LuxR C-terminal-related transcriptional regulator [Streptomyces samsunensis]